MARRAARKNVRKSAQSSARTAAPAAQTERDKIIEAFLALLSEKRFAAIGFDDIAQRTGLSLAQLRREFASTLAILAAHIKATDRAVLAQDTADMAEEPARERLFDVLMRRLDVLAAHRDAVRSLLRSARTNPPLAMALNGLAVRSQQWMLTAADIHASGPRGMLRAQGLALMWARVLRTFVNDEDEGHARTMAELDRALGRGARLIGLLDDMCRFVPRFRPRRRRYRDEDGRRPRDEEGDEYVTA